MELEVYKKDGTKSGEKIKLSRTRSSGSSRTSMRFTGRCAPIWITSGKARTR